MECFVFIGWPKNGENTLAPPVRFAYCRTQDRKNKCKSRWTERSRSRRTVRVEIERISVKVQMDRKKGVEVGLL